VTWTRLASQPGVGLTQAACPTNPGTMGSTTCPIFRGALAVNLATGDTFALAVDVNNLDQGLWQDICALSGANCTANEIAFATRLNSAPLEVGGNGLGSTEIRQGDYDLTLAAVANGSDTPLFAGTVDLYRCSIAAGCVLRNTTNAENGCAAPAMVSPAQHAIAVLAGAGTGGLPLLYIGNDGGAWRSVDGVDQQQTPCSPDDKTHFQNLNGGLGSLAEVVSFAQDPTNPATLLAGLGANGTAATSATVSGTAWPQIAAGEGGTVAIDAADPLNWYVSIAAGVNLTYCGDGSGCTAANFSGAPTIGSAQVDGDLSLIDAPFLLDPQLTTDVLIGTCRIWRGLAESGAVWPGTNAISAELGSGSTGVCDATNAYVRSLAAGGPASGAVAAQDAGSTVLYAGMAGALDGGGNYGGHIFANYVAGSAGASTVWTDVSAPNPRGFDISSIAVDAHDATGMTVYATVMGFAGNGENAPHVYRSISGGASWTDISRNLPNAPANSVLVDPNDANTVYVAMDTGVYATQQVTTCATTNCWSVFGTGLPNAPVVELQASAGMATGDGRFGELRAATYGRGIWEIPLLTAAGAAAPAITLQPTSLTFAAQQVGTASAAQTIMVTNSGNATLTVTQVTASGDFTETDNCSGGIAAGATCTVNVKFLPTATGARSGVVTVYGNVAGGQATAQLSGTGVAAAAIVLNPLSVTYSGTNVGSTSAAQNITVSNTGGVTASLQTPVVTGDFTITANTCGASLATNTGCTVAVAFVPAASGTLTGTLSITDSAGTQTAQLSGTGVEPATDALAPLSLTFAAQQLSTSSAQQQVTLTNNGDAPLTLIAAQITSGDFTVVNGCGNSLNGHSSCALLVAFVPTALGARNGVLTVADVLRSQTVSLNGTGIAPPGASLAPVSPVAFGVVGVGLTTAAQTVTLTNNGGAALAIASITATGDFAIVAGSNTCGASLATGLACTMQVEFTPTAAGARTGIFTVADNVASSPQTLQLTGTGVDFSLTANGATAATISAGSEAVYPLLLSSAAGVPGTVTFTCGPVPLHATCLVTPATPALGGTTSITVTVATSVAGAKLEFPGLPYAQRAMWFAMLLPLGMFRLVRRRLRKVSAAAIFCGVLAMAGCSVSRIIPETTLGGGTTASPTPSGTYNLTVTGASAGLTRSVGLTLVVQ